MIEELFGFLLCLPSENVPLAQGGAGKKQNPPAWMLSCLSAGWSWWSVSRAFLPMGRACYQAGLIAFVVGTKMLAAEADTGVGSLTGSKKAVWQWSRGSGIGE